MQCDALTNVVAEWHGQAARLLPQDATLVDIDPTPFSASTAPAKAVMHLRAVHVSPAMATPRPATSRCCVL